MNHPPLQIQQLQLPDDNGELRPVFQATFQGQLVQHTDQDILGLHLDILSARLAFQEVNRHIAEVENSVRQLDWRVGEIERQMKEGP